MMNDPIHLECGTQEFRRLQNAADAAGHSLAEHLLAIMRGTAPVLPKLSEYEEAVVQHGIDALQNMEPGTDCQVGMCFSEKQWIDTGRDRKSRRIITQAVLDHGVAHKLIRIRIEDGDHSWLVRLEDQPDDTK